MRAFGSEISGNRSLNDELSERQRDCIIAAIEAGAATREVAALYNTTQRTVQRILKRWETTGSTTTKPRSGRPSTLSHRERRKILRIVRKYPKIRYK